MPKPWRRQVFRGQKLINRTGRRGDLVIASCLFSAKGAISIPAWGDAPGIRLSDKQALKARFNRADVFLGTVNRAFSAGDFCDAIDPGALPQARYESCAFGASTLQQCNVVTT